MEGGEDRGGDGRGSEEEKGGRDVVLIGQGEELAEESLFLTKFAK